MKITALNAKFIQRSMGDAAHIGVMMNCPCGCDHKLYVPFADTDSRLNWTKTGETIETLTLSPSVHRTGDCPAKWHGWIRNGEAIAC